MKQSISFSYHKRKDSCYTNIIYKKNNFLPFILCLGNANKKIHIILKQYLLFWKSYVSYNLWNLPWLKINLLTCTVEKKKSVKTPFHFLRLKISVWQWNSISISKMEIKNFKFHFTLKAKQIKQNKIKMIRKDLVSWCYLE